MAPATLHEVDEWVVEQADLLVDECFEAYEGYDFGAVMTGVHNFCRQQLSAFYSDAIKDFMYCDREDSERRRSGQYACYSVAKVLAQLMAPVLVHTAEEAWTKMHETMGIPCESIHMSVIKRPDSSRLQDIEDRVRGHGTCRRLRCVGLDFGGVRRRVDRVRRTIST